MALTVNSNIASLNAQRNLGGINSKLSKSIERLSSGLRINNASDDAAGMAIATKLGTQVRGLNQAIRNANNAITLTQTAEGGINTVTNILHRLRELAVQSASDDNTSSDRANLAIEADNLTSELTRMVNTTEFNTSKLLDGSFKSKFFQVGANFSQKVTFTIGDVRGKSIGGRAEFDADITDGVVTSADANFGQSEVKVNTFGVAATSSADDQYSVINISSGVVGSLTGSEIGALTGMADAQSVDSNGVVNFSLGITVNDVTISLVYSFNAQSLATNASATHSIQDLTSTAITGASLANDIVSAIANNASLTALNITARTTNGGSGYVIEATKGTNITMLVSMNAIISATAGTGGSNQASLIGAAALMSGVTSVIGDGAVLTTGPTAYNGESSAVAKAAAINAVTTSSGVTASAEANVVTGGTTVAARTLASGDMYINGTNIGAVTVTASDGTGALISAINNVSSDTGVTADTNAEGKLVLTAADGRNIAVTTNETADANAIFGTAYTTNYFTDTSAVFRSSIQLNDDAAFTLTGTLADLYDAGSTDANNVTKTTATEKSVAADLSTYNIATMSISTQANAEAALLTIDAAMDDVNGIRASIGAVQNRLEFTVANLEIASENTAASQSRILDADFAVETAEFTRNQILVQAATAMLAQANTLPQAALQLLG
jgi:flagellin